MLYLEFSDGDDNNDGGTGNGLLRMILDLQILAATILPWDLSGGA